MPASAPSAFRALPLPRTISGLQDAYYSGSLTPGRLIDALLAQIEQSDHTEIWISKVPADILKQRAASLDQQLLTEGSAVLEAQPLFGIPFAVKDNIDTAGLPTTAACPAFSYLPEENAIVVERLLKAGAILIGKTNLDQFATGLVGTRSPYGVVRNAYQPDYVSGGSSSGSAVALALGQVMFSLGTDTAGSGRVPAGFNNLVGLKPTRGLISTKGLVPACRSLDCISIFAHTVGDAWHVLQSAVGFDAGDAYSRTPAMLGVKRRGYRIAIPESAEFFGDTYARAAYEQSLEKIATLPDIDFVRIPLDPFTQAAQLLYQGPWVAERRAALGAFFDTHAKDINPIVHQITAQAAQYDAVDTFKAQYRLAELRREAEKLLENCDFLLVPTTPTIPTIATVATDPITQNSRLGYYTNFVNLMDMAALAIPAVWRQDGLPAGLTLIGPAGSDHRLAEAGARIQHALGGEAQADRISKNPLAFNEPTIKIAVVGAHLSGQALNWQLLEAGARLQAQTTTSPHYRLYALANTTPPKPGLVRTSRDDGAAIQTEVWEMPLRNFGSFVGAIPSPLGIGTISLADGCTVKGFICEPAALENSKDITHYGGWLAYRATTA